MRLVLREKKIIKEGTENEPRHSWDVMISPQDFLNLAELSDEGDVEQRGARLGKFDKRLAEGIQLFIDPSTGTVISHDGRARAKAAENSKISKIQIKIRILEKLPPVSWNDLPQKFYQQKGGSGIVPKSNLELLEIKQERGDLLNLGSEEVVFNDVILRAGERMLSGDIRKEDRKSVDAEKEAEYLLQKVYSALYKILRAENSWGPNDYSHHDEVADETDKVIRDTYSIEDVDGPLEAKVRRDGYYRVGFTRPTKPPITIRKK